MCFSYASFVLTSFWFCLFVVFINMFIFYCIACYDVIFFVFARSSYIHVQNYNIGVLDFVFVGSIATYAYYPNIDIKVQ